MFEELKEFGKRNPVTQAQVVEGLLRYFFKQDPELQHRITSGIHTDEIGRIKASMQLSEWGNHAYSRGIWPWAIETFNKLYELAEGDSRLVRLSTFKLGSAWMDLAMKLRSEGVRASEDRKELYYSAVEALRIATAYFIRFNMSLDPEPPHPTALYNQACALSLIAQYLAELDLPDRELRQLASQFAEVTDTSSQGPVPSVAPLTSVAGAQFLDSALERLRSIKSRYSGTADGMPLSGMEWLFEYAVSDSDLAVLRARHPDEFSEWLTKQRKSRAVVLDSFKALRLSVPKDIDDLLRERVPDV